MENKDWVGNRNSIWKTLGASSHTNEVREEDDFYATDPDAVDALLTVETPSRQIWECAAGAGHLAERLKQRGFNVYTTDVKERGYQLGELRDFLTVDKTEIPTGIEYDILTNPPYKYAKEFVQKSLELLQDKCKCYMFLKLQFLEGVARYNEIFQSAPPKAVYVFKKRVLCAKNGEFERMKASGGSAVAYAWFVWKKGFTGKTTIDWI